MPGKPDLTADALNERVNRLAWKKVGRATRYELARNGLKIYDADGSGFSDGSSDWRGVSLTYSLKACNRAGCSSADVFNLATRSSLAQAGRPRTAASSGGSRVDVSWDAVANAETHELYRSESSDQRNAVDPGNLVYSGSASHFADLAAPAGKTVYYGVRGCRRSSCGFVSPLAAVSVPTSSIHPLLAALDLTDDTGFTVAEPLAAKWSVVASASHSGGAAVRSGKPGHSGQSCFRFSRNFSADAVMGFDWSVSSESGRDGLKIYLDGVEKKAVSGTAGGKRREHFLLRAGPRSVGFCYAKDSSGSAGLDAGTVDRLSFSEPPANIDRNLFAEDVAVAADGRLYARTLGKTTWDAARNLAEYAGGRLALIGGAPDNALVAGLVSTGGHWIGYSDDGNRISGASEWKRGDGTDDAGEPTGWRGLDGKPPARPAWFHGEPNNYLSFEEDCAVIYGAGSALSSKWNDVDCSTSRNAVVEFGFSESSGDSAPRGWPNFHGPDPRSTYRHPGSDKAASLDGLKDRGFALYSGSETHDVIFTGNLDGSADALELVGFNETSKRVTIYDRKGAKLRDFTVAGGYMHALMDVDLDGVMEIAFSRGSNQPIKSYVYRSDGSKLAEWSRDESVSDRAMTPLRVLGRNRVIHALDAGYSLTPRGVALYEVGKASPVWEKKTGTIVLHGQYQGQYGAFSLNGNQLLLSNATVHNGASAGGTEDGNLWVMGLDASGGDFWFKPVTLQNQNQDGWLINMWADLNGDSSSRWYALERHDTSAYGGREQLHVVNPATGSVTETLDLGISKKSLMALFDASGDGKLDLLITSHRDGETYLVEKTSAGNLKKTAKTPDHSSGNGLIAFTADLDGKGGDEFAKIVAGNLHLYDSSLDAALLKISGVKQAIPTDLSGDGVVEMLVLLNDGKVRVYPPLPSASIFEENYQSRAP